jgi:hypothetical protein
LCGVFDRIFQRRCNGKPSLHCGLTKTRAHFGHQPRQIEAFGRHHEAIALDTAVVQDGPDQSRKLVQGSYRSRQNVLLLFVENAPEPAEPGRLQFKLRERCAQLLEASRFEADQALTRVLIASNPAQAQIYSVISELACATRQRIEHPAYRAIEHIAPREKYGLVNYL